MKKYRYHIGIDPGTKTGFAMWDATERKFIIIETTVIHWAIGIIKDMEDAKKIQTIVRVEDARLRSWFGKSGPEKLQGAGSIKRDCSIWDDFLKDIGIDFEMVEPKRNLTKLSSHLFEQITKYNGKTSEHGRDAAMLVFGR